MHKYMEKGVEALLVKSSLYSPAMFCLVYNMHVNKNAM